MGTIILKSKRDSTGIDAFNSIDRRALPEGSKCKVRFCKM